eukprot:COSAG01_NODE_9163_length_2531_cov_2.047678_1_plen_609_part_10
MRRRTMHHPSDLRREEDVRRRTATAALIDAAILGEAERAQRLITGGADANGRRDGRHDGDTALGRAAFSNHISTMVVLVDAGADLNKADGGGASPLIRAAQRGHTQSVQWLLDQGSDWCHKNLIGQTALDVAQDNNMVETAAALEAWAQAHPVDFQRTQQQVQAEDRWKSHLHWKFGWEKHRNVAQDSLGVDERLVRGVPMVVCPFLFSDLVEALTLPVGGKPTWYFCVLVVWSITCGLALLLGGLLTAREVGDPLLALSLFFCAATIGVVYPLILFDLRATLGNDTKCKLSLLGAGSARIPVDKANALHDLPMRTNLAYPAKFISILALWTIIHVLVRAVLPLENNLVCAAETSIWLLLSNPAEVFAGEIQVQHSWGWSWVVLAPVLLECFFTVSEVMKAGTVTLRTATALISTRVQTVTDAVKLEAESAGQDISPTEWERTVVNPCRELIGDIHTLSEGWARSILLGWAGALAKVGALVCVALSRTVAEHIMPVVQQDSIGTICAELCKQSIMLSSFICTIDVSILSTAAEHIDVSDLSLLYAFQGIIFIKIFCELRNALHIVYAPAEISTSVGVLQKILNDIRVSDLSTETHDKVFILECALSNSN